MIPYIDGIIVTALTYLTTRDLGTTGIVGGLHFAFHDFACSMDGDLVSGNVDSIAIASALAFTGHSIQLTAGLTAVHWWAHHNLACAEHV